MREGFRAWTETIETFILEVIIGQRRGAPVTVLRAWLFLLSKVFQAAVQVRRFVDTNRKVG